jgi:ABC-2 type transport system ATP-binding protein
VTADANLGDAETGDGPTATTTAPAGSGDDDVDSVIEVSGLRMSYEGFEAVRGIDLRVHRGEIFASVGPNGAQARSADAFTEPTSTSDSGSPNVASVSSNTGLSFGGHFSSCCAATSTERG